MEWFIYALQRFRDFEGRSRRREFWYFTLFHILLSIGAVFLDNLFGFTGLAIETGPIQLLYILIMLIPAIAVSVRRLHDIDKTGFWYLLIFLPILGWIWLLIFFLREGTYGPNKYGPDPKEELD